MADITSQSSVKARRDLADDYARRALSGDIETWLPTADPLALAPEDATALYCEFNGLSGLLANDWVDYTLALRDSRPALGFVPKLRREHVEGYIVELPYSQPTIWNNNHVGDAIGETLLFDLPFIVDDFRARHVEIYDRLMTIVEPAQVVQFGQHFTNQLPPIERLLESLTDGAHLINQNIGRGITFVQHALRSYDDREFSVDEVRRSIHWLIDKAGLGVEEHGLFIDNHGMAGASTRFNFLKFKETTKGPIAAPQFPARSRQALGVEQSDLKSLTGAVGCTMARAIDASGPRIVDLWSWGVWAADIVDRNFREHVMRSEIAPPTIDEVRAAIAGNSPSPYIRVCHALNSPATTKQPTFTLD